MVRVETGPGRAESGRRLPGRSWLRDPQAIPELSPRRRRGLKRLLVPARGQLGLARAHRRDQDSELSQTAPRGPGPAGGPFTAARPRPGRAILALCDRFAVATRPDEAEREQLLCRVARTNPAALSWVLNEIKPEQVHRRVAVSSESAPSTSAPLAAKPGSCDAQADLAIASGVWLREASEALLEGYGPSLPPSRPNATVVSCNEACTSTPDT